ncbi:DUF3857 domain-containing protein [Nonlabens sp. Asnod3-A02]|uniref:DUF3857 domain-containing protein n=1 Tax=Nonlabens sp. Asnod3-A02 TaxID=3160579 RepID=UPI003868B4A6
MKIKLLLVTVLASFTGLAQNLDFDKVSNVDFELEATDSVEHDAIFIYRNVDVNFRYEKGEGFVQNREIHERIKINNEAGIEYATKRVRLWDKSGKNREVLRGLKGATYNLVDGKIEKTKLKKSGAFDDKLNDNWKMQSFTMPNVRIGSVIEYKYFIDSPFPSIDDIDLQKNVPILQQDVKVLLVEFYLYNVLFNPQASYVPTMNREPVRGTINLTTKNRVSTRFETKTNFDTQRINIENELLELNGRNIPALDSEPMSGNLENYRAKLIIELSGTRFPNSPYENFSTTWQAVSKTISANNKFGDQLNINNYFKDDLDKTISDESTQEEKLVKVFRFVKNKVKWNGVYGKFVSDGVRKAYKEGSGNIAEINLMLIAMLREVGLDANPVLVSSRDNGIPLFPTQNGFNYVVAHVKIDNKTVLLDATETYIAPNLLPLRAANWLGRLIQENGDSSWIELNQQNISNETVMLSVELNDDMTFSGNVQKRQTEYIAYRTRYKQAEKNMESMENFLINEEAGLDIDNLQVINLNEPLEPLTFKYDIEYNEGIDVVGGKVYISPLLFESNEENPFKRESRKLPVDLIFPLKTTTVVSLKIPDGYEVESIPEVTKIVYGDKVGSYTYIVENKGEEIVTRAIFDIKKPLIAPENYESWRKFYISMIDLDAQKIVLKKI